MKTLSPEEYCQKKAAQSGSSFYYSFFFLPPEAKKAMMALYAFCREVDDAVDDTPDPQEAQCLLLQWRKDVIHMCEGTPRHPVTRALLPHLHSFNLEKAHLMAVIDGMEMDLTQHRYADYAALERYCWHVASAVGILSSRIFGSTHPDTQRYAEKLGLAFQLTNVIRDVGEDAVRDRIYLPADEMAEFGVSAEDILAQRDTPAFEKLMRFQVARAQKAYDDALASLPDVDRKAQRPGLVMAAIYRSILNRIEQSPAQVLHTRTSLSTPHKLWLAWKAYAFS